MLSRSRPNDENATVKARRPKPPTVDEVICAFLEHLECAVHTILFQRDIYPKEMFMTARKYDRPVKMCRVPKVNEYVRNMVDMVGVQLREGGVQVVSIVILSKDDAPLERFVFNVSHVAKSKNGARKEIDEDLRMEDLHAQFVDVISSLEACSYSLDDLPQDCTFTVMIEMDPNHENPRDNWVISDEQACTKGQSKIESVNMRPIRSITKLRMQIWVEESSMKQELTGSA